MTTKVQLHNVARLRIMPNKRLIADCGMEFAVRDFEFLDDENNVIIEVQCFGIADDPVGWTDIPEKYNADD